ncbi:kinase-like domain-containing protein [Mycena floridula]|nr:kinase-like domain-containing protein [Mycena floridula]
MTCCDGCGTDFPLLQLSTCQKCVKLKAVSVNARKAIQDEPQCQGCSVCYPFLDGDYCGRCKAALGLESNRRDRRAVAAAVTERAAVHERGASEHRLHQPSSKQNQALQSASSVNAKMSNLRKLNKQDSIRIEAMLYLAAKEKLPKKSGLPPYSNTYDGYASVDSVLVDIVAELKSAYLVSPLYTVNTIMPNFQKPMFGVGSSGSIFTPTTEHLNNSLDLCFRSFQSQGHLSTKNINDRVIPLRVTVAQIASTSDDEEFTSTVSSSVRKAKRKSSISAEALRSASAQSSGPSRASASAYSSAWNPRPRPRQNTPSIEYEVHFFTKITMTVEKDGSVTEERHEGALEDIDVAQDWQDYKDGGEVKGGYIGQGLSKYAFMGRYNGNQVVVLQCKDTKTAKQDLSDELHLLHLGQYFVESFKRRATVTGYELAVKTLRWNSQNAFLGILTDEKLSPGTTGLISPYFLVTQCLPTSSLAKERKFSGNQQTGDNHNDVLGQVVDALAHHIYEDSGKSIVFVDIQAIVGQDSSVTFFDPQAHSDGDIGELGPWDGGSDGIASFVRNHRCNRVCQGLKLTALGA